MSTDLKSLPWRGRVPEKGWLSVESADHLSRGDNVHGLQGKLDEYLESQVGKFCKISLPLLILSGRTRIQKITLMPILLQRPVSLVTPSIPFHSGIFTMN